MILHLMITSAAWVYHYGWILFLVVLIWLVENLRFGSKIMNGQNVMIGIYERWTNEHHEQLERLHELLKGHMAERETANARYLKLSDELMQERTKNLELWDEIMRQAERPSRGSLRE